MSSDPLFILGCPRSGTTLLAELVGRTPYGKPTETQFIVKYWLEIDRYGDLSDDARLDALTERILAERAVMQWKLETTPSEIRARCEERSYVGLVDAIMGLRAEKRGYPGWGDKTPHYTFRPEIVDRLYPRARYLFIVRDGRDVALSLLGRRWGPNNFFSCAEYWADCNKDSDLLNRLEAEGRLLRIRYEDLLEDPEPRVRTLYEFLDHPISEEDLSGLAASIRSENRQKWKSRMSDDQIELFENVAGDCLRRFGYPVTHPQRELSGATCLRWRLHDRTMRFIEFVRSNTIDAVRIRFFGAEPFAE